MRNRTKGKERWVQRYKTALISVSASRVAPDEPLELRVDRQLHEPVILRRRCCRCCARILAARRVDIELECRVVGQHSRAPRPVGGSKVVEQLAFYVGHLPAYTGAGAGHSVKRSASRRASGAALGASTAWAASPKVAAPDCQRTQKQNA